MTTTATGHAAFDHLHVELATAGAGFATVFIQVHNLLTCFGIFF
jgi:hypothetical protein